MKVVIDSSSVEKWLKNTTHRERSKTILMRKLGMEAEKLIREEAENISSSGKLESSIRTEYGKEEATVYGEGYSEIALETGRRPGRMPPVKPLEKWAISRGMPKVTGFLIARKIASRGTDKYIKGRPKQITRAVDKLERFMDKELPKWIDKYLE